MACMTTVVCVCVSTAFLALFLSRSSQHVCVCVCVWLSPPLLFCCMSFSIYSLAFLGVLYEGRTQLAPAQRLRKHLMDAAAGVDNFALHKLMSTTQQACWGICVLRYETDGWWTAVRDREWWWQVRRWVVNDVAPRILDAVSQGRSLARGWLKQKVLRVLHELRCAQDSQDNNKIQYLQVE